MSRASGEAMLKTVYARHIGPRKFIRVSEYWPAFVDRDSSTQRVSEVESFYKIGSIDWLMEKVPEGHALLIRDDHVLLLTPNGEHWVLAHIRECEDS